MKTVGVEKSVSMSLMLPPEPGQFRSPQSKNLFENDDDADDDDDRTCRLAYLGPKGILRKYLRNVDFQQPLQPSSVREHKHSYCNTGDVLFLIVSGP